MKLSAPPKRAKSANSGSRDRDRDRPSTAVKGAPSSSHREDFTNSGYSYPENNSRSRSPPRDVGATASLNGSFSSNVSNEMLEVKINRKRAESDLQLLANR